MNKKRLLIMLVAILLVIGGIYYYIQRDVSISTVNRTYPEVSDFSFYAIHEFKQKNLNPGPYNTMGYVAKIYLHPPCPIGAVCKPSMMDNIVISENNKMLDAYSLTNTEIIVFSEKPKQFELGKKYMFSVELLGYKSTGEPINDIKMIGYSSTN